jgi:inorganic pyrophosphatase
MDEPLHCLVEIPKGSRNKYEWDEALGGIKLDRCLFSSVVHSTDYGFVIDTLAEDGDPLEAEIEHFFSIGKQPEGKEVIVDGWHERALALQVIDESRDRRQETRS